MLSCCNLTYSLKCIKLNSNNCLIHFKICLLFIFQVYTFKYININTLFCVHVYVDVEIVFWKAFLVFHKNRIQLIKHKSNCAGIDWRMDLQFFVALLQQQNWPQGPQPAVGALQKSTQMLHSWILQAVWTQVQVLQMGRVGLQSWDQSSTADLWQAALLQTTYRTGRDRTRRDKTKSLYCTDFSDYCDGTKYFKPFSTQFMLC